MTDPVADQATAWEGSPRRLPGLSAPVLSVDGFEGPLDWLLELARSRRLDLRRLSILALAECFGEAMQAALVPGSAAAELTRWAAWTVMASQLAELRSRLLLHAFGDAPEAGAGAEGPQRLDRAAMLAATDWLERRPQLGRDVFGPGQAEPGRAGQEARAADPDQADAADEEDEEDDDLTALLRACLVPLRLPANVERYQPPRPHFWSVAEASARITRMLPHLPEGAALELFLPEPADGPEPALRHRAALAATLNAALELARSDGVSLAQEAPWQSVQIGG